MAQLEFAKFDKAEVVVEQIEPRLKEICLICQREEIPYIATVVRGRDDADGSRMLTSAYIDPKYAIPEYFIIYQLITANLSSDTLRMIDTLIQLDVLMQKSGQTEQ